MARAAAAQTAKIERRLYWVTVTAPVRGEGFRSVSAVCGLMVVVMTPSVRGVGSIGPA